MVGGVGDRHPRTRSARRLRYLLLPVLMGMAQACFAANPVLLVSTSTNQFSLYYAEILRAEGLNAFDTIDISALSPSTLTPYDLVILGQVALSSSQVTTFTNWVNSGGNLIAMRPDKQLAGLLGITDASATLTNGYLVVNTANRPGAGIVGTPIQFHDAADLYSLSGATAIATLYANASTATANPAVTLLTGIGTGGQAAAFTYDLAKSVVWTRQGNPNWAGQNRDGDAPPVRSDEMFFGAASFDPEPDWVDRNNIAIPQADEQQRLLANLILFMNQSKKPLPRFWYLPFGYKAAVLMTGDDHANGGTILRFNDFIADSTAGCSVANWQCIRGTSYVYPNTPMTNAQAANFVAQGFEVALHVTTNCLDWTSSTLDSSFYTPQLGQFASAYPSVPAPVTNRTHCIAWSDWGTQPLVELNHGIRLDTDYYYWPPGWVVNTPGLFTGSGFPMRFAELDGTMVDVYQATTQMPDESQETFPFFINSLLANAFGSAGYYGVFTANMHTDFNGCGTSCPDGLTSELSAQQIVAAAQSYGAPVVSAKQMLQWLDGRNTSSFGTISWNSAARTLSFTAAPGSGATGLQGMLPVAFPAGSLTGITLNGATVTYTTQTIKGIAYAFFPVSSGNYVASYTGIAVSVSPNTVSLSASQSQQFTATVTGTGNTAVTWTSSNPTLGTLSSGGNYIAPSSISTTQNITITATSAANNTTSSSATVTLLSDSTPATISNISVTAGSTSATITWSTNKTTNSRVDYGTSSTTLTLNASNATLVTAHTITLTGLTSATTYYFRVTSADAFSTATVPPTGSSPSSFVTIDTTPPVISALTAMPGPSIATIAWTTDKAATSSVAYGASPSSLTFNASNSTLVTAHSLSLTGLILGTTYYFRVTSVDTFGNSATSPITASAPASFIEDAVSVWSPSATPAVIDSGDTGSLEVGMRFRSDVGGLVTGVRFYKSAANTGTHTGHLWSNAGALLGSVTFSNETASGWQQAFFAAPVAISANTTYVVSYYAPSGRYSVNSGFFASAGVDNAPLHALANGVAGANGVYNYGAASSFPTQTFSSSNYWVDLVFTSVPPVISSVVATPTNTSATITWTTDTNSSSRVDYGTSSTSLNLNVSSATLVTSHSITLTGLTTGTTYYFRVTSTDSFGNGTTSPAGSNQPASFVAAAVPEPVISAVTATPGSTSATITWTTDETSTSRVDYGTSSGSLTLNSSSATLVTAHSITLTGLALGTTYYYRVTSVDSSNNSTTSPVTSGAPASFTTSTSTGPVISAVAALAGIGGAASITWTTSTASSSRVDYGTTSSSLSSNVSSATLVTSHSLALTGLTQSTVYYYRVTSVDSSGNSSTSPVTTVSPAVFMENAVSIWAPSAVPATVDSGDTGGVEVGTKVRSDLAGVITGVRFYKAATNTGTHIGNLWSSTGTRLGTVTFTGETASGWQQANFSAPIAINANTTYVISYYAPAGHYSVTNAGFASGVDNAPLHALANGVDGSNGVYLYGASSGFPNQSFQSSNYWVDVVFVDNVPPAISAVAAVPGSTTAVITWTTNEAANSRVDYGTSSGSLSLNATNTSLVTSHSITLTGLTPSTAYFYEVTSVDGSGNSSSSPAPPATATFSTTANVPPTISGLTATPLPGGTANISWTTNTLSNSTVQYGTTSGSLTQTASNATLVTSHSINLSGLTAGTTYFYQVTSTDSNGLSSTSPASPASFVETNVVSASIWSASTVPTNVDSGDTAALEAGMRFRSDLAGIVTGVRFYKASTNTGTHIGNLWSNTGTLLGTVTFTGETASGWQQANFSAPIAITANTTYVVSYYAPAGHYSFTASGFASGVDNAPLHALADGLDGANGVYLYGASSGFPNQTFQSENYWVDLVFVDNVPPAISSVAASPGGTSAVITWTTNVASSSRVDYGTSSGSLNLNTSNPSLVTAHSITLTGLTATTTYFYRVTSVDTYGNTSSSPASPASFVTTANLPPVISGLTAMPGPGGTAAISWTTNTPSSSKVAYGTTSGSLTQTVTAATLVTAHSLTLTGLTQGQTYFYQVTSTDAGGLSSTSPASPASFAENAVAIWSATAVPGTVDSLDTGAVELGVKFRSDVAGNVLGVLFYKSAANTGTHIGHLWSSTGTLLATVTFANESASGWQQAFFSAPVAISANTTYVMSYYAPAGHYSDNTNYFASSGADNAPLHALANGVDGTNGVYLYGSDAFPNLSWNSSNYWVDVIFH